MLKALSFNNENNGYIDIMMFRISLTQYLYFIALMSLQNNCNLTKVCRPKKVNITLLPSHIENRYFNNIDYL